jgi:hypothetical protein
MILTALMIARILEWGAWIETITAAEGLGALLNRTNHLNIAEIAH